MGITKQFGDPRGLLGRLLVSGMNLGHTPMAKWGFTQITVPQKGEIADIGCGGGRNLRRLLERSREGHVFGVDLSPVSVEMSCWRGKTVRSVARLGSRPTARSGGFDAERRRTPSPQKCEAGVSVDMKGHEGAQVWNRANGSFSFPLRRSPVQMVSRYCWRNRFSCFLNLLCGIPQARPNWG